jgi:hypothetical protein
MAVEFQVVRVDFPPTKGVEQRVPARATFSGPVRIAQVALQGFQMEFTDADHHIGTQRLVIEGPGIRGNTVEFTAFLLFRDRSGSIDDRYGGFAEYLVAADVAPSPVAPVSPATPGSPVTPVV